MIIKLADQDIELLPEKAVWNETLRLLCVADLHFEKDSFFGPRATFLPPYGSQDTLERLQKLIVRLNPSILVAAGDSFHDKNALARMPEQLIKDLNALVDDTPQWLWLSGNHDPAISALIRGTQCSEAFFGGIRFRHDATQGPNAEISGHYHPKVRLRLRGHLLSEPCFVQHKNRLIVPSFGQYTGGLDINSQAFTKVVPAAERRVFLVQNDAIFLI